MASVAELFLVIQGKNESAEAFKKAGEDADGLASKLGGLGKLAAAGATVVAGGAVAAGAGLFKVGQNFDDAFDTIAIGTGATGDALKALEGDFKSVYTSVPTGMGAAAMAIADLNTRTGATGPTLQELSTTMLEMTRLTGGDLSTNIAAVTRLMGDWGVSSEDGSALMDKLFLASQSTGIGIDTLASQMVQFGAPLRQLGFGLDTSAALLGKFEKEGVNAELVMGSMRIALGKMAREGEPAEETLARTVESIKNAGSASEANALALELFGARAGPDMAAAIREGRFAVDDLVAMMGESEGAIADTAKRTADFGEAWTVFKNKALSAIEPVATKVFALATRAMGALSGWFDKHGPTIHAFFVDQLQPAIASLVDFVQANVAPVLAVAFDALKVAVEEVYAIVEKVVNFFKENESAWQALAVAIGSVLVVAFTALAISAGAAALATLAAMAPLLALIVVIGAVGAAIFLLIKHWDDITAKFPALGVAADAVKVALQASSDWITGTLVPNVQTAFKNISTAIGAVIQFVSDNWGTIEAVVTPVMDAILLIITNTWDNIKVVIETVLGVISGLFKIFKGIFTGDWDSIKEGIMQVVTSLKDGVMGIFENMLDLISGLFVIAYENAKKLGGWLLAGITDGIGNMVEMGANIVRNLWSGIESLSGWILDKVGGFAGDIAGKLNPKNWFGSPKGIENWFPYYMARGMEKMRKEVEGNRDLAMTVRTVSGGLSGAASGMSAAVPAARSGGGAYNINLTFNGPTNSDEVRRAIEDVFDRRIDREFGTGAMAYGLGRA